MIDLHLHILPGIDDGPGTLDESVATARAAVEDGIRTVAATPHIRADHARVRPGELLGRCRELSERLSGAGLALEVVAGGEVDLGWAMTASADDLRLVSYAQSGSDLLVETPYGALSSAFEERLFELSVRGYRLLLAHPERNPSFQREPDRLRRLVDRGVLAQITARSLVAEGRRSPVRRFAAAAVRERMAHVIATDAHGAPPRRPPDLSQGVAAAAAVDPARAEWMVSEAPRAILAGTELAALPESAAPRRFRRSRRAE